MSEGLFDPGITGEQRKDLWEKAYVMAGLWACGGCKSKAAQFLGMSQKTFYNKMEKYPDVREAMLSGRSYPIDLTVRVLEDVREDLYKGFEIKPTQPNTPDRHRENMVKKTIDRAWFKDCPRHEQEAIIRRIREKY